MSTASKGAVGGLPRQPSALLPPPINEVIHRSPLRNEYQGEDPPQSSPYELESQDPLRTTPVVRTITPEPQQSTIPPRSPNPIIALNDQPQDLSTLHGPFVNSSNFETISLDDEDHEGNSDKHHSPSVDPESTPRNFSRPREGTVASPAQRPSIIVTDGSLPQLHLDFSVRQVRPQQTASSIYEDDVIDPGTSHTQYGTTLLSRLQGDGGVDDALTMATDTRERLEAYGHQTGPDLQRDNVKDMIQEWERVNGRFGRQF
jgi:hypothetical protein